MLDALHNNPYASIHFISINSIYITHFILFIWHTAWPFRLLLYIFYSIYLNRFNLRSCILLGNLHFTSSINHHHPVNWIHTINIVSPLMSLPFSLTIRSFSCFSSNPLTGGEKKMRRCTRSVTRSSTATVTQVWVYVCVHLSIH